MRPEAPGFNTPGADKTARKKSGEHRSNPRSPPYVARTRLVASFCSGPSSVAEVVDLGFSDLNEAGYSAFTRTKNRRNRSGSITCQPLIPSYAAAGD